MKHYNPSIVQRAQRLFNTKGDNLPDEVSGPVAVIPITPTTSIVANASSASTGTTAVLGLSSAKDTYLTGALLMCSADATCDGVTYTLSGTVNSAVIRIAEIRKQTLTAGSERVFVQFSNPIKLDRGTSINMNQSFTAGASVISAIVYGYTEEVTAN